MVASILSRVALGPNYHREDAPHFNLEFKNKNEFSRSVFQTASEMYVESADDSLDEITSESGIATIMDPRTARSGDRPVRLGPRFSKFSWSWFGPRFPNFSWSWS